MAAPDARQRRTIATPTSYSYRSDMMTIEAREGVYSLPSRWHSTRTSAPFALRALMRALELCALAFALFFVPATIQHIVRALDTVYEVVGRRARTTFDEVRWGRVVVGGAVLVVWHAVLIVLSYRSIISKNEEKKREEKDGTWSRILARVLVPAYLVAALAVFFYSLAARLAAPSILPVLHADETSTPYD